MEAGLKYAIQLLERGAARHKFYKVLYRHHCQMEACLSARNSLKRKLRSVIKESLLQSNNTESLAICASYLERCLWYSDTEENDYHGCTYGGECPHKQQAGA